MSRKLGSKNKKTLIKEAEAVKTEKEVTNSEEVKALPNKEQALESIRNEETPIQEHQKEVEAGIAAN